MLRITSDTLYLKALIPLLCIYNNHIHYNYIIQIVYDIQILIPITLLRDSIIIHAEHVMLLYGQV